MEVKLGQKQFPVLKSRLLPASNFSSPNGLCLNPSKDKGQSSSKLWRGFPKDFHLLVGHKAVENKCRRTIECLGYAIVNQKICMSSQKVHIAVHPVYVVALVLLIAVCMRCIVDSFGHQLMKTWKHEGTNKANTRDYKQRNSRWKSAISNEMEVDVINCESQEDYVNPPQDQCQDHHQDMSHAYTKLEADYVKFLSECGISKWGYWRGGSVE